MWDSLYRKVRFAVLAAIPLDAGFVLAALNGNLTWHQALVAAAAVDIPVIAAWAARETKLPGSPPVRGL